MATLTAIPSSYSGNTNFTFSNTTSMYTDSNSSTYATCTLPKTKSVTCSFYLDGFNFSSIPSNATINSVTVKLKSKSSSTSYITNSTALVCKGTTKVGTSLNIRSTSPTARTISAGTWTRNELDTLKIFISATRSTNTTLAVTTLVYGADVTVDYTVPEDKLLIKDGGSYKLITKAYKKVSGSWVEQDIKTLFNTSTKYIKL